MIDFFFKKINYVRYPIDERLFRKAFEAVYQAAGQITEGSVRALPLIAAVLATAYRLAPADEVRPEEAQRRSLSLYWDAQFSLTISTRLNPMSIRLVETRIILGLYLIIIHGRRLAEGWSMFQAAVSSGQILGLHRDGTKVAADLDPYMIEYRRRLWSYLCHADATFSCLLNRPPSIDPVFNDTKLPSNINLSALVDESSLVPGKPMSETTDATYLILRRQLADIVRQIVRNFQRVDRDPTYDDVLALDAKLNQLRKDLPPQFRLDNPDTSQDKDFWYLPIHRYYIQTEILHYTIILHRPWFLRDLKSDRYSISRQACTEATRADFAMRSHFRDDVPDFFETLRGGSLRQFMPAMIAGISILLEPSGEYADIHRQIVDRFLEDHDKNRPDGYSREEVEIVGHGPIPSADCARLPTSGGTTEVVSRRESPSPSVAIQARTRGTWTSPLLHPPHWRMSGLQARSMALPTEVGPDSRPTRRKRQLAHLLKTYSTTLLATANTRSCGIVGWTYLQTQCSSKETPAKRHSETGVARPRSRRRDAGTESRSRLTTHISWDCRLSSVQRLHQTSSSLVRRKCATICSVHPLTVLLFTAVSNESRVS
ncbi:hypothetical protein VHUM_00185 [Vanrija humicola]|uniref:Xylanolytic transcriptional activator regulatory domain-containing protein n=1 Tax=Vanrija humicola TaxID=5417 RepID=A0A7D8Z6X6_VANHU|nr:hypothetical protein VHUM_00185 [Vanrija humicola]